MNSLETSLYGALSGGTALTALLAGTTSIYNSIAPQGSSYDMVIFNLQGGGDANETPRRRKNLVYQVKAVSATSMKQAGLIDAQIDALLHAKQLTVTGWTNFLLRREQDIEYVETTSDGNNYWHNGGLYRVLICE